MTRQTPLTPEELQVRGRLSQTCPCGITEAAGSYCTSCLRPMGPADWGADDRRARSERLLEPSSGPEGLAGSVDPDEAENGSTAAA